jgi:hypothetical protein
MRDDRENIDTDTCLIGSLTAVRMSFVKHDQSITGTRALTADTKP